MHNTCQKQTRCKATFLNIRAAEIACREMQNMIETHTHCLTAHTHTDMVCCPVLCQKWLLELAHRQDAKVGPKLWSKQKCARKNGPNKNALDLPKCVPTPPSHTFICTTGWSRCGFGVLGLVAIKTSPSLLLL